MSKPALKKYLSTLSNEQLVEVVMEAYGNSKAVQDYFDFYLKPNEEEKIKKYKTAIIKEFNVNSPERSGLKYSVAKKSISEFASLKPSPEALADVMLTLPEAACLFTYTYGDMDEPFYNGAYNNFKRAIEFIAKHGLLEMFKQRCTDCVKYASPCGYSFADEMMDLFYEYYGENAKFTNRYGEKYG